MGESSGNRHENSGVTAERIKNSLWIFMHSAGQGVYHSLKHIPVLFYLDQEMNKKHEARKEKLVSSEIPSKKPNKEKKKEKRSRVLARLAQCSLLNGGIFLLSIVFFDFVLIPALKMLMVLILRDSATWPLTQMTLSWIFSTFWILPLFLLSKIINTFFWQDIADAAYEYRKGKPMHIPSISLLLADVVFSLLVQTLFLVQTMALNLIPYVGSYLSFFSHCLLYSLYSFEYKWFNQGIVLHKRLTLIEVNWPYYFGFGFTLALLTLVSDSFIISGCLFSVFFPLFIISGNDSDPSTKECQFPIRFFALVVFVSNTIFNRKLNFQNDLSTNPPVRKH